jgi:adenine-specific DNA glycosylase
MAKDTYPRCAQCPVRACENREGKAENGPPSMEKAPAFCPMKLMPEV